MRISDWSSDVCSSDLCLAPGGILVTQNGVPFLQGEELTSTMRAFRALFKDAACYLATVPTYTGGPMAFGWGSDDASKRRVDLAALEQRYRDSGIATRYYHPAVHLAAFPLPHYVPHHLLPRPPPPP